MKLKISRRLSALFALALLFSLSYPGAALAAEGPEDTSMQDQQSKEPAEEISFVEDAPEELASGGQTEQEQPAGKGGTSSGSFPEKTNNANSGNGSTSETTGETASGGTDRKSVV